AESVQSRVKPGRVRGGAASRGLVVGRSTGVAADSVVDVREVQSRPAGDTTADLVDRLEIVAVVNRPSADVLPVPAVVGVVTNPDIDPSGRGQVIPLDEHIDMALTGRDITLAGLTLHGPATAAGPAVLLGPDLA